MNRLYRNAIRWTWLLPWDLFRILVIIPASIAFTALLLFAPMVQGGVHGMLANAIEVRESLVGDPADGMLLAETCSESSASNSTSGLPIATKCDNTRTIAVSIDDYVSELLAPFRILYMLLVILGFGVMVATGSFVRYWPDEKQGYDHASHTAS